MKPELQIKFLQHLNRKKNNEEGFTLIELLVVVIIIGILAAIALPSLLGQVNKAKQAEAKNYTGSANRAQQAFFLENSGFASNIQQLQLGIQTQTTNYSYSVQTLVAGVGGLGYEAVFQGSNQGPTLKSYYGLVATQIGISASSEPTTSSIACESIAVNQSFPTTASLFNNGNASAVGATQCVSTYTNLAK